MWRGCADPEMAFCRMCFAVQEIYPAPRSFAVTSPFHSDEFSGNLKQWVIRAWSPFE
jgi:hypothetical protein